MLFLTDWPILLKLGIQHRARVYYQVCSNDDPRLTFDLFPQRSTLLSYLCSLYGKRKMVDYSETIEVYGIKVGIYSK